MKKTVAEFQLEYFQCLDANGAIVSADCSLIDDINSLLDLYRAMQRARLFDQKAVALQRTGQIGTYPSILGQEAIGVAMGKALQNGDVLAPYYRDQATHLSRGVSIKDILLLWGGHERGYQFDGDSAQDLPGAIPISTQITHAAGIASAFKIRGEKRAVMTSCGDGATSRGDFLESINLAGVWNLPMVIIVNNNQWAISVPLQLQTACETLAQKAVSAGIHGEQVDGNDVIALSERIEHALERARCGKGPTLIEAISYRLGDHTTADDASRYREQDEVKQAWAKDPIKRLQTYLAGHGYWNEQREAELQQNINHELEQAVADYLAEPNEDPIGMFDYLYAELPQALSEQREAMQSKIERMQQAKTANE